ncbi:Arm DNA-binding domain-containing protein [Loktanella sp. DJP18]|uniref:Arm DNA-binding domain-containing protein n=1 Tax=Loktanella sp. DJP18 TaxID=3409788 RepID=UPI003BB5A041
MRLVRTPGRYYYRDGLILTVSPGSGKSWSQRIATDGRRRDVGLGSAHLITPAQARKAAMANRDMGRAGGSPLAPDERQPVRLREGRGGAVTFAA